MVKDYVELIDSMNEKITLAEESNAKTRTTLHKKLQMLERNILEKLEGAGGASLSINNFTSFETTLERMESEISALKKDILLFKDKTSIEVKQGLEIQQNTRDDYIKRIKDIYDDQSRVVRETQLVMNNSRESFDAMQRSIVTDIKT